MKKPEWLVSLKTYEGGRALRSISQLTVDLLSYFLLLLSMFYLAVKGFPYWMILILALPASGFLVRLFIIMHDCGHNSFFKSSRACSVVGITCGVLSLTPYNDWKKSHAVHHATVSNLDKRGTGDIWTMTVDEYINASLSKKIKYRIFRNPFFLFGLAPLFLFIIIYRFPHKNIRRKELNSILFTDLIAIIFFIAVTLTLGITVYLKVLLPIAVITYTWGTWLFYVQHQFQDVYWSDSAAWDRIKAAMMGSSFYKLPGILQWFSGNIGFHHIHHLSPKIPNYNLKKCFKNIPELQKIVPITLKSSLKSLFLYLWDEKTGELVNFKYLHKIRS